MSRRIPNGKCTQSNQPKDICILLVNDDDICKNIVAYMLDHCRYEAFSYKREMDALNIIRQKKDVTKLILTNVHRTYAKRHGIIEHVEKKIKLKITLMSLGVDDKDVSSTVGGKGVTVYFMKCLSVNDMNNLWAAALAREKIKKELSSENSSLKENEGSQTIRNDDAQHGNVEKKPRVVWTDELHQKFLEAVAQLGEDKAFPKKIVELMNVPGLTRANVGSHLQKYRLRNTTTTHFNFGFKTLPRIYQQFQWNPFQMGSRNTTTTHFNLNYNTSRSRTPQRLSLLKTIRFKPDHKFSVYGDETKNVLLRSIKDDSSNKSFAGFKFTRDGKSVVFGQNSHLASSVQQQQLCFPEMRNDWTQFSDSFTPSVAPLGVSVSICSQLSSLAVDEPMPAQPQPSAALSGFDWTSSSVVPPCPDWNQLAVMTPPQSAVPQWAEPRPSFSPQQQQLSEDTAKEKFDIFDDFTSTYIPPELCELGVLGDDIDVDATAVSDFDYLLFDDPMLT